MSKKFISFRWKLISTYLLLSISSIIFINGISYSFMIGYFIDEKIKQLAEQTRNYAQQLSENLSYEEDLNNETVVENISDLLKNASLSMNSRLMFIDEKFYVVVDAYDDYSGKILSNIDEVKKSNEGYTSYNAYKNNAFNKVVYIAMPIYVNNVIIGSILVISSLDDVYMNIAVLGAKFIVPFVISIFIFAGVGFVFSQYAFRPIDKFITAIKNINTNLKYERVEVDSNDEFAELAEQFNSMITKIEQVDERRDKFVSNVSHELRSPIASIKIISETLTNSPSDNIEVYKDFMIDINSELTRLSKIIDTLLNLVKFDKGELKLEFSQVNLNNLVMRTINLLKPMADMKHISLNFITDEVLIVNVDRDKLAQAFINIVNNAIKYTYEGGYINVSVYTRKDDIAIEVTDSGMGIPEKDFGNIFDRFYRVDEARARDTGGTGLGLSIAQQIMKLHSGNIELKSKLGEGSTFTLVLPKSVLIKN